MAPSPRGAPSQLLKKKKKKNVKRHSRARARSRLMLAAECRWSELMDNYAREKTSTEPKKKKKDENEAHNVTFR